MEAAAKQFKKRNAILACLRQTRLHPSAEMVYEMLRPDFPDISLATVYRNLSRFKSEGLIQSLGTVNGIERFDADTGCGRVMDLPQLEPPLSLGQEAEASTGCHVESCQLTFSGLCGHCQTQ